MSQRFKNKAVIAQGMLAPSGYYQNVPDPVVQSTTRPAGTLLKSSPGYDSIRPGKNRFQGKGPTGGFRPQTFAEDVGGTGAALSITPGDTTQNDVTEWLPEDEDSMQLSEGSMIISDRRDIGGDVASILHGGQKTIPDMGDRAPHRPLSRSRWLVNPVGMFRADIQESPAITVAATIGFIVLVGYIANDAERQFRSRRGRGAGGAVAASIETPPAVAGDTAEQGVKKVSDATDDAVDKIGKAADAAVTAIEDTAKDAKQTVTGE
jgi:hypothetical protein